ncbi:MAG: DUF1294 domain-containing protein [Lachnospiraceae bacterium]|nr:DUF1294 domain-containing protein [Lachnospiraceae bacterium]MCI8995879.1 DUF1294 domain-containing protein [Lachnospiraceae bacterium]
MSNVLFYYLLAVNILAFSSMGSDKKRARQGRWRIPEKTLFLLALLGGSIGSLAGMHIFRHKTRHWYFRYGIPAILVLQVVLFWFLRSHF